jgi:hypothetical protein
MLLSPAVDMEASGESFVTNQDKDPFFRRDPVCGLMRSFLGEASDPRDPLITPTLANGQPAAAAYHRDGGRTHHALGVAVLTATPAGIARITVFADGPSLVAKFGLPPTQPERGQ